MKRRGFLRLLGAAPVAGPIAAKEAVSDMAVSVDSSICPKNERIDPALESLIGKASRATDGTPHHINLPPNIESMKSWSATFKQSEAIRAYRAQQEKRNKIWSIVHDGDMSIAEKTLRLAALGVKV